MKLLSNNPLTKQLKNFKRVAFSFGQLKSIVRLVPVDSENQPIPWYTYPCIEYLKQFDFSTCSVFEWGSGNSSKFWACRVKSIVSLESDPLWFKQMSCSLKPNQQIKLERTKKEYISKWLTQKYDIIIIDGDYRDECSKIVLKALNESGMIILDNSERFPKIARRFRNADLIQIDFAGFGPINNYTWVTSIFMKRDICLKPVNGLQPKLPIGTAQLP